MRGAGSAVKLLVVTQYFHPENFRVNDLVEGLVARGHEVTVLTGLPNYPAGRWFEGYGAWRGPWRERLFGAEVLRVPMLARGPGGGLRLGLNFLSFALAGTLLGVPRLRGRRFDAIFVFEVSPVTVGLPAIAAKRLTGAPILFWVLDLWPESLTAAGGASMRRLLRPADALTRWIYRRCDRVLAQSRGFLPRLAAQGVPVERVRYFPSWAESLYRPVEEPEPTSSRPSPAGHEAAEATPPVTCTEAGRTTGAPAGETGGAGRAPATDRHEADRGDRAPAAAASPATSPGAPPTPAPANVPPPLPDLPAGFRVLFAGNIGAAQDFPTLLAAADALRERHDIQWLIAGDGRVRPWVEAEIERRGLGGTVRLLGALPMAAMPALFARVDALLVTLRDEPIFALTIPGKIQSYLACGRPVIAALAGEGARVVTEAGAGVACPPESPSALASAVRELADLPAEQRRAMGERARACYLEQFDREQAFARLEQWVRELHEPA